MESNKTWDSDAVWEWCIPSSHIAGMIGSVGGVVRTNRVVSITDPRPPRPPAAAWVAGAGPTAGMLADVALLEHAAMLAMSGTQTRTALAKDGRRIPCSKIDDKSGSAY